jgi:uncharacterized protein
MIKHIRPSSGRSWHRRALAVLGAVAATAFIPASPARAAPAPSWWSYDRAPDNVPVVTSILVPTRDGTNLACDLTLPADVAVPAPPRRVPGLVLEFTPYVAVRQLYNAQAQYFAGRGYAAIVCNVRGTGASGGTWQGVNAAVEATDNYDLIEWMAARPWSNGRIGQSGESYGGFTAYRVAALQPPHLLTIVPQQSQSNLYTDVVYPGGMYATPGGTLNNWPEFAFALSGGRIDPAAQHAADAAHPLLDGYWKQIAINTRYRNIRVPVLAFGGLEDRFFRAGMVENYLGLRANTWAVFGPWMHASPIAWPGCPANVCNTVEPVPPGAVLAWFDRRLMQLASAPLPASRLTVYEGPVGVGEGWRDLDCWGSSQSPYLELALNSNGSLGSAGPKGSATISQPKEPTDPGGSVTFTTPPLRDHQVIGGFPKLNLVATLSAGDAHFYVELLDIASDGAVTVVNDGHLKATHSQSHEYLTPVNPGKKTTFEIPIRPDLWRFAAGHRLSIRISGGAAATFVPVTTPVTVTIATGTNGSTVKLPKVS